MAARSIKYKNNAYYGTLLIEEGTDLQREVGIRLSWVMRLSDSVEIIEKIKGMQRQEAEEGSWLAWQGYFITV